MKHAVLVLIAIAAFSLAASAETIRGVVRNGTTNRPSAGDEVTLKKIAQGMEDAGKTTTNSKGEFTFNAPPSQAHYLVWVKHQEVTYPKVVVPGTPLTVQVFDSSAAVKEITLLEHIMAVQTTPAGDSLRVDALFTVANQSSPPRTMNGQHTFDIYLPDDVKIEEATAQTPGSIPLKTAVVPDKSEKNKYFFGYPLRPGQTQFRLGYSVPYTGKLSVTPKFSLPAQNMLIVTPASMKVTPDDSTVYTPRSDPQLKNLSLYVAKDIAPNSKLGFQLQGTGEMPRDEGSAGGQGGGQPRGQGEDTRPGGGLGVPNERPDPLHNGQWLFLGVLVVFLTAGAIYVYMSKPAEPALSPQTASGGPSMLLEAMKEELFQLESDRLQGKITSQEYESTKAALDKTLQRAVKRNAAAK